jgi:hypothetical protein
MASLDESRVEEGAFIKAPVLLSNDVIKTQRKFNFLNAHRFAKARAVRREKQSIIAEGKRERDRER